MKTHESRSFDVFISHSSKDKAVSDAVCAVLEANGIRCWIAPRDVLPGMPYGDALIEAIHQSRVMVLILSASANDSGQVMREVERAVSSGIPIIPLKVEDFPLSKSLEYFLGSVHWLEALSPPLERHLQTLARTVRSLLSQTDESENHGPSGRHRHDKVTGERWRIEEDPPLPEAASGQHSAESHSHRREHSPAADSKRPTNLMLRGMMVLICLSFLGFFAYYGDWINRKDRRQEAMGPEDGKSQPKSLAVDSTSQVAVAPHSPGASSSRESGFTRLFDGETFQGWEFFNSGPSEWIIEEGKIIDLGRSFPNSSERYTEKWLGTRRDYADFSLRLEFRLTRGANSGIFLRAPSDISQTSHRLYLEVQLVDDEHPSFAGPQARYLTGSLWNLAPSRRGYLKPAGEWNGIEIRAKGPHLVVLLNGTMIVDDWLDEHPEGGADSPDLKRATGRLGLQCFQGRVEFRNISVKELN